jgi:hypothetical protein
MANTQSQRPPATHTSAGFYDASVRAGEQFDNYFVALVFTLLAASVESAGRARLIHMYIELLAWAVLAMTGFIALIRLPVRSWRFLAYRDVRRIEERVENSRDNNQPVPDELETSFHEAAKKADRCKNVALGLFCAEMVGLMVGISLLLVSRGAALLTPADLPRMWFAG